MRRHYFILNRPWIYFGSALFIVIFAFFVGFNLIKKQASETKRLEASRAYERLHAQPIPSHYSPEVVEQAQALVNHYPRTPYATFALLHLARQAVYDEKFIDAVYFLMQCIDQSDDPELKLIALQRAMRVLVANHQPEQAQQLLNHSACQAAPLICQKIKGDLLTALGQNQEAQHAYQIAAQPPSHLSLAFDRMNAVLEPPR